MFDFMRNRPKTYGFSAALVLISLISFVIWGLNLGIDFTGGTVLNLNVGEQFSIEETKAVLAPFEELSQVAVQVVQGVGLSGVKRDEGVVVKAPYMEEARRNELMSAFKAKWPTLSSDNLRIESVGPVVGSELTSQALLSLAVAIVLMIAYITLRFEFKFALATIITLLHNVLIVAGVFSLFKVEINLPFVAAILTIFGYSVNDTIVIYDRVRENIRHRRKTDYHSAVNESINQSLMRCVNTSLTTLFVMVALFVGFYYYVGNADLIAFAVAIILGIFIGTYSSIFVAAPLWFDLQKVWAKR